MTRIIGRSGFTLIEVLIALGLSVMLISAIYASVDLYYRYQTLGRAEIRGQQLMRSLTRMMARDIGSVIQQMPEPVAVTDSSGQAADAAGATSSTSNSTSSSNSSASLPSGSSFDSMAQGGNAQNSSSGTASSFMGLVDAGLPVVFGVVGTEELLHLTVSLPSRDLNYRPLAESASPYDRSGDLLIVTFGLTTIDSLSMTLLQKNLKTTRPGVGLGRRTRDLYSPVATDEVLEPQHLIAPEVTELRFRYFDSGEWLDSWDSITMGRLPRAIEADFGFWNPPLMRVGETNSRDPGTVTHVQYIFKVPLSVTIVE